MVEQIDEAKQLINLCSNFSTSDDLDYQIGRNEQVIHKLFADFQTRTLEITTSKKYLMLEADLAREEFLAFLEMAKLAFLEMAENESDHIFRYELDRQAAKAANRRSTALDKVKLLDVELEDIHNASLYIINNTPAYIWQESQPNHESTFKKLVSDNAEGLYHAVQEAGGEESVRSIHFTGDELVSVFESGCPELGEEYEEFGSWLIASVHNGGFDTLRNQLLKAI